MVDKNRILVFLAGFILVAMIVSAVNMEGPKDIAVKQDIRSVHSQETESEPIHAEKGCSEDHDQPGFKCPNARQPDFDPENPAALTEKCEGCGNQVANGGSCPGKYA